MTIPFEEESSFIGSDIRKDRLTGFNQLNFVGMAILKTDFTFIEVNQYICNLLGIVEKDIKNYKLVELVYSQDLKQFYSQLKQANSFLCEIRLRNTHGEYVSCRIDLSIHPNEIVAFIQDISEKKEIQASLEDSHVQLQNSLVRSYDMAMKDVTTDLANMYSVEQYFSYLNNKPNLKSWVFAVDIKNFRSFNHLFGFKNGDSLLKEIASRLSALAPTQSLTARISSDMFVIVCDDIEKIKAVQLGKKIEKLVNQPYMIGTEVFEVLVNTAAAQRLQKNDTLQNVLLYSEALLEEVKQKKIRKFSYFLAKDIRKFKSQLNIEKAMDTANLAEEIIPYVQPILDLGSGKIVAYECLARWSSPTLGIVGPDSFINIAEKNGKMNAIFLAMLEKVTQIISANKVKFSSFKFHFNLSPIQLHTPNLVQFISQVLKKNPISSQIEFEIIESSIISDEPIVLRNIKELQKRGFHFSIDDFGTGHSNLAQLAKLKINSIKLDKSLLHLDEKNNRSALLTAALSIANALNLEVIVEGVETKNEENLLKNLNFSFVQGYLYSKPFPIENLLI